MTPFIEVANVLTSEVATCATAKGKTLSTDKLREIERWLAAHFYSMRDPLFKSNKTADASAVYNDRSYLEVAEALDKSGCLASFFSQKKVSGFWLGKAVSDQIPYVDRD